MVINPFIKLFRKTILLCRKHIFPKWTIWFSVPGGKLPSIAGDSLWEYMFYARSFEDLERSIFLKLSQDVRIVLDVGANIGLYTLMIAGKSAWNGKVYAVEASPQEFKKLSAVVSKNRLKNVELINAAAGHEEGSILFEESLVGYGALNRIVDSKDPIRDGSRRISIPVISLDRILKNEEYGAVGLVKLDVEGSEIQVLKGMKNILRSGRPTILIEMDSKRGSDASSPSQVWDFLEEKGYSFYKVRNSPSLCIKESVKPSFFEGNFFAVHEMSEIDFEREILPSQIGC
jgi:FkbM family methyltransferase